MWFRDAECRLHLAAICCNANRRVMAQLEQWQALGFASFRDWRLEDSRQRRKAKLVGQGAQTAAPICPASPMHELCDAAPSSTTCRLSVRMRPRLPATDTQPCLTDMPIASAFRLEDLERAGMTGEAEALRAYAQERQQLERAWIEYQGCDQLGIQGIQAGQDMLEFEAKRRRARQLKREREAQDRARRGCAKRQFSMPRAYGHRDGRLMPEYRRCEENELELRMAKAHDRRDGFSPYHELACCADGKYEVVIGYHI